MMRKIEFPLNRTPIINGMLAAVVVLTLVACSGANNKPTTAVITSPIPNTEVMVGQDMMIQGQVNGQNIARVDVVVDSKTHVSLPAADKANGVLSFPVQITWTTQIVGAHFVQLNVYGTDDKLIAKSDAVIFSTKPAPETPTPTLAPPTATAVPTTLAPTAVVTNAVVPTATVAAVATVGAVTPTLTITNEFANVRSGPGTNYDLVGRLNQNDTAAVRGKALSSDGTWWQIVFAKGPNGLGWVRGDLVSVNSAAASVAVVAAPATPTSAPAPPTSNAPTAAPTNVAAATAVPSGPVCNASTPDWKGSNPNYPFCGKQDPTWGDPQGEFNVYDNGRDIPLYISWNLYGSNINQVTIHFDYDSKICGFDRKAQKTVNQVVPAAGRFDFNISQFPYGGTYKVYLLVNLTDGRTVQYGEKKLCIR
jgi:uncharacterized protein YraI